MWVVFLEHVEYEDFLDELPKLEGGREARDAIQAWLDKYGMRCVGHAHYREDTCTA